MPARQRTGPGLAAGVPALTPPLSRQRSGLVCRIATVRALDRAALDRSAESLAESRRVLREADHCLLHLRKLRVADEPASTMATAAGAADARREP